jgi:hypothetical protein
VVGGARANPPRRSPRESSGAWMRSRVAAFNPHHRRSALELLALKIAYFPSSIAAKGIRM